MRKAVVFFSGFERVDMLRKLYRLVEKGFPMSGILVSYMNIETKTIQYLKRLKYEYGINVMLDSGAFSLIRAWEWMNGQIGFNPNKRALELVKGNRLEWYFKKYFAFVKKNVDLIDVYVELDLQLIVGNEKVNEWRDKFRKEGLTPVLVWHGENIDGIDEMLQYSDHFGLPWRHPGVSYEYMMSIVRYVRKKTDGWIHWFGMTKWSELRMLVLERVMNSADSTSWMAAQKYGNVYVIDDGGRLLSLQISPNRQRLPERRRQRYIREFHKFLRKYKDVIEEVGLNFDKIYNFQDWEEISFFNLLLFNQALLKLNDELNQGKRIKYVELDSMMVKGSYDFNKFDKYKKLDEWLNQSGSNNEVFKIRKDDNIMRWLR